TVTQDPDGDTTVIESYYINGELNDSTATNTTFNASDGHYILNASLTDGVEYRNLTVNFTIDTTAPVVNTSLNKSLTNITVNDMINLTANATDLNELSFGQIIVNISGFKRYFNFSLDGAATAAFSQNITINITRGEVINFTARVNDSANNFKTNDTMITVANTPPADLSIVYPRPDQYTNEQPLDLNVTFTDADNDVLNISYYINGELNQTSLTNTTLNISEGYYILNVSVSDGAAITSNVTVNFTLDITAPNVTFKSPTPSNNTIGDENVVFNWTAFDYIGPNITCYPAIDSVLQTALQTPNGSHSNTTLILTGGNHSIKVTCFDTANNSNTTEERIYTVGIINITIPGQDEIIRPSEKFRFNVSVLAGEDWINNITLIIFNETFHTENLSNLLYNYTYTVINVTPRYINATAYGFNNNIGPGTNVTSQIQLRIGRLGTTQTPTISYVCPNESYTLNATNITIETISGLDTLVESYNVTIIMPNQETEQAIQSANATNASFAMSFNCSYLTTLKGTYTITATVKDIENQTATLNSSLTVSNSTRSVNITKIGLTSLVFNDVCTGKALISGDSATIPNVSYYDADSDVTSAISITFKNISLSGEWNNTLNHTARTNETAPPAAKRRIHLWDLGTNMSYNNATLSYDYSSLEYTLMYENQLDIYKCANISNCVLEKQTTTLNTTTNIISLDLNNLSRFMVTEPAIGTIPGQLDRPAINYINFSRTYTKINDAINITVSFNISFQLDTITLTVNSTPLTAINTTVSGQSYRHTYNYSPATLGPYLVEVTIEDENTFNSNRTATFYATNEQVITINAVGLNNMTLKDTISKEAIESGTAITTTLPSGKYEIFAKANKTEMTLFNSSINDSVSTVIVFSDLPETITAPGNRTNLDQFEVNSSIGFANIDFTYNYSNLTESISDEGNLEVYKCSSTGNCTWSEIASTVDTDANTISFSVSNLSVFDIVESIKTVTETETITTTTTISSVGGGGGGSGGGSLITRVAALDLIVPSTISMHINDSIKMPITLKNSGEIKLNNINLTSQVKAEGITVEINDTYFEWLDRNETVSTSAIIRTQIENLTQNEIAITSNVHNPALEESAIVIINVIDVYKGNRSILEQNLQFMFDLFEKNPECLELKELLTQAEKAAEENEFEKALALTESAINSCRQLIGKEELRPVTMPFKEVGLKITLPLIILALIIVISLIIYGAGKIRLTKPKFSLKFSYKKHKHRIGPSKKELKSFESEEKEIRRMLRGRL
ncbi:hypothetical protein KY347_00215, partial [Candidatus Woesearchaeota archaeon]|nr:hypothetical protein [Candidatus Woesearchaeota archaeon]